MKEKRFENVEVKQAHKIFLRQWATLDYTSNKQHKYTMFTKGAEFTKCTKLCCSEKGTVFK